MTAGRNALAGLVAAVVLCLGTHAALAAFGTGGKRTVNAGGTNSASEIVPGKGGSVFGVGSSTNGATSFDIAVVKLDKNGAPDNSFSGEGLQLVELGGFDVADAGIPTKDGGVVVAGKTDSAIGSFQMALAALKADGSPDNSFSSDGQVVLGFGGKPSDMGDIAILKNGNYVVAGTLGGKMIIASVTKKGKLDKGFGQKGSVKLGFQDVSFADDIAVDRQGRIVVSGSTSGPGMGDPESMAVARLKPDGKLDKSFSKDGQATVKFADSVGARGLGVFRDGRIVMTGPTSESAPKASLAMLGENGKPVKSFGQKGKVVEPLGSNLSVESLAIQKKDILIGGGVTLGTKDFMVARFTAKGKLDDGFGNDGLATVDFNTSADVALGIAVGGKQAITAAGLGDNKFGFARWTKDGDLDD